MLKYYLDKTGKVIKSILFPSSEFVDTEPREGSMNPVTSGGVAGGMAQQSSNIAPNYTKTAYPAHSYVMHDGILYTNTSTINAAEDWNPAHWTVTTVADMVRGGPLYVDKAVNAIQQSSNIVIELGQRQLAHCRIGTISGTNRTLQIKITSGTTDAILFINKNNQGSKISNFAIGGTGYGTVRAAGNVGLNSSLAKYNLKYLIGPGSPMAAPTSLEQISVGSTEVADANYLDPASSDANFVFVQVLGKVVFYGGFKPSSMGGINPWPAQW